MAGKFVRVAGILERDDGDVVILFDPKEGKLHKINQHAFLLWKLLEKPKTIEDLKTEIEAKFKLSEKNMKQLVETIDYLKKQGLIKVI